MAEDGIKVTGHIKWELVRDGKVVQSGERANVVTTAGKQWLAQYLTAGSPPANVGWMGFGTSTTAPAAGDTALGAELTIGSNGYARPTVTKSNSSTTAQWVATLTGITTATTIQEVGLFNASTAGTLIAHQLTGAVTLQSSADSLQITWQITFS